MQKSILKRALSLLVCLAILMLWPKINDKIPASLIAVLVGTLAVLIFKINANTHPSRQKESKE